MKLRDTQKKSPYSPSLQGNMNIHTFPTLMYLKSIS